MNSSVPFEYIWQKVDVRITLSTIEVFYNGNRICSHHWLYGRFNQYSTLQEHMPPEHQKYVQWNGNEVPSAYSLPNRMTEYYAFLQAGNVHSW